MDANIKELPLWLRGVHVCSVLFLTLCMEKSVPVCRQCRPVASRHLRQVSHVERGVEAVMRQVAGTCRESWETLPGVQGTVRLHVCSRVRTTAEQQHG